MKRKIALISGCFDGIDGPHKGHLYILSEIRKLADYTVVTLNSDAYLARKGPGRPLSPWSKRCQALYESGLVDEVIPIEDSPLEMIKILQPDFICTGRNDYAPDEVVGARECVAWGGKAVVIEKDLGVSTTQMVKDASNSEYVLNIDPGIPGADHYAEIVIDRKGRVVS